MKMKQANEICGTLSNPSKMPGKAWGIPAAHCITGGILRNQAGSVCAVCYALKGRYVMPKVQAAYQRRLDKFLEAVGRGILGTRAWEEAMVALIDKYYDLTRDNRGTMADGEYFRWFDSGDLQSKEMLLAIMSIANSLPWVKFYLPTKEHKIVRETLLENERPANLIIRASGSRIDGPAPNFEHVSTVETVINDDDWRERVESQAKDVRFCPARQQGHKCLSCRSCWDPLVKTIVYAKEQ